MTGRSVQAISPPQRIIELKLPLSYLLSLLGALALLIVGMYYRGEKTADQLLDLKNEVIALKAEVKTGNTSLYTLSSSMALLQFRVENAESDIRQLKIPAAVPAKGKP